MRERSAGRGPADALRRPLARPRPGRGAGGRAAVDPPEGAARGRDRDRRPGAGRGAGRRTRSSTTWCCCAPTARRPTSSSVVVDDHDMGVTHVIRGDDHLNNAVRQTLIYRALGWTPPGFAHLPLIHGPDGAKLSKRHGASAVDEYRDMGYLPEAHAQLPAAARLGPRRRRDLLDEQAIAWFDIDDVGRAPARLDWPKLTTSTPLHARAPTTRALARPGAAARSSAIGTTWTPTRAAAAEPACPGSSRGPRR